LDHKAVATPLLAAMPGCGGDESVDAVDWTKLLTLLLSWVELPPSRADGGSTSFLQHNRNRRVPYNTLMDLIVRGVATLHDEDHPKRNTHRTIDLGVP